MSHNLSVHRSTTSISPQGTTTKNKTTNLA
jgi:hypothetical protein